MKSADTSKTAAGDREELDRLNQEYIRSVEDKDVGWFECDLAPDFMNSNPGVSLAGVAGFLVHIGRVAGLSQLAAHDVIVRLIGGLGIFHARTIYQTIAV